MHPRRLLPFVAFALLLAPSWTAAQSGTPLPSPTPPTQPATGPGGADYAYAEVVARHYGTEPDGTTDPTGYWLFEPAKPRATAPPAPLPLILFFHGYFGTDPVHYRAWIDHLVRRGNVVVYPDYQPLPYALQQTCPNVCSETVRPTLPFALAAIRAALAELKTAGHPAIDLTRVGATGHSWGGMLSVKYAAIAAGEGLPVPSAVMPAMPGCVCDFARGLETIPATTRVIVLAGHDDDVVHEVFARQIWESMTAVPIDHRDYVRLLSDRHGAPGLLATHGTPATDGDWGPLDAYDWYGTWKLFDALTTCSFAGTGCETALGNSAAERFMGTWSDGTPVIEAEVTKDPTTLRL